MPTVETNGTVLRYVREGSGDPVLLLHGYLFGADWWRPQMETLRDGFDVIAVDLRGQMRSPAPDDPDGYDLWNQAEDIRGLLDALGVGSAHIVGLSMGGMIALRLTLRHPERVRSLVLMDTTSRPEAPENADRYEAMRQIVRAGQLEEVLPALPPVFFSDEFIANEPQAVDAWLAALRGSDATGLVLVSDAIDRRDDVTDRLDEIKVPALVIHGRQDVPIPFELGEELAARIPGARFAAVDGAHQSNVDSAAETSRLIREFLQEITAAAGIG